jgi:hypothetical protein
MKTFYTDKDIEELHSKGVKSLRVTDDVALTDLAYEKARRLGIQIADADSPPAAPVRPYLSDMKPRQTQPSVVSAQDEPDSVLSTSASSESDIAQRIRSAVIAKLGDQVDASLLDNIIHRVVKATGLK